MSLEKECESGYDSISLANIVFALRKSKHQEEELICCNRQQNGNVALSQ